MYDKDGNLFGFLFVHVIDFFYAVKMNFTYKLS